MTGAGGFRCELPFWELCSKPIIGKSVVHGAEWRNFLIVCFCLGFSAFYELIEWWVAVLSGESAEAFLGTQGYLWDTQADMILALLMLSKLHDTQLNRMATRTG